MCAIYSIFDGTFFADVIADIDVIIMKDTDQILIK